MLRKLGVQGSGRSLLAGYGKGMARIVTGRAKQFLRGGGAYRPVKTYRATTNRLINRGRGITIAPGTVIGHGAYRSQRKHRAPGAGARKQSLSGGIMRIQHKEYIGDVLTAPTGSPFASHVYYINPGLSETFPWLSSLAANFQEYKMNACHFEFKSTSADALNSVNTALGTVMMATQYNSAAQPFANKIQMENSDHSCSGPPSLNMLHGIECAPSQTPLHEQYVRFSTQLPPNPQMFDLGQFQLATSGMQNNGGVAVDIGELWVSYDVTLLKPILTAAVQNIESALVVRTNANFNSGDALGTAPLNVISTELDANAYNNTQGLVRGQLSQMQITFPSNKSIAFPVSITEGAFLIQVIWQCTGADQVNYNWSVPTQPVLTNAKYLNVMPAPLNTQNADESLTNPDDTRTSITAGQWSAVINVDAPGAAQAIITWATEAKGLGNPTANLDGVQANIYITPWSTLTYF